jgi:hypothetical protein
MPDGTGGELGLGFVADSAVDVARWRGCFCASILRRAINSPAGLWYRGGAPFLGEVLWCPCILGFWCAYQSGTGEEDTSAVQLGINALVLRVGRSERALEGVLGLHAQEPFEAPWAAGFDVGAKCKALCAPKHFDEDSIRGSMPPHGPECRSRAEGNGTPLSCCVAAGEQGRDGTNKFVLRGLGSWR